MARLSNEQMKMVKKSIIYDCQKCGYSGKFFDVRRHYGSAHLSVQQAPFACYICEKPFGAFTELERHIKQKNHEKRVQQMSASGPELELSRSEMSCRLKTPTFSHGWEKVPKHIYEAYIVERSQEESELTHRAKFMQQVMLGSAKSKEVSSSESEESENEEPSRRRFAP